MEGFCFSKCVWQLNSLDIPWALSTFQCGDRQFAEEMLKSKTHDLALNQTTNLVLKLALIERWVYSCRLTSQCGYRAFHTPAKHFLHGTCQRRTDRLGWASPSTSAPTATSRM